MIDPNEYKIEKIFEDEFTDRSSTEAKIFNAAIFNFSDKGYHNTKTKDIATKAGIAEGTIFRYFKTKEEILLKMYPIAMKLVVPKLIRTLEKSLSTMGKLSLEELAVQIILDRLSMLRTNKKLLLALIPELIYRKEYIELIRKHIVMKVYATLDELVIEMVDEPYEIDRDTYCKFVFSTMVTLALKEIFFEDGSKAIQEQEIRHYINRVLSETPS